MSCISEQSRDVQEVLSLILHFTTKYCYRMISPITSTNHIGNAHPQWIDSGGRSFKKDRQFRVFLSSEPDVRHSQEEFQYDLDKPRIAVYNNQYLENSPKYSILVQFEACSEEGLQFYQTPSHAVTLSSTLPAFCIEKVVRMKIGAELCCKVHQSPRLLCVTLEVTQSEGSTCYRLEKIQ